MKKGRWITEESWINEQMNRQNKGPIRHKNLLEVKSLSQNQGSQTVS